MWWANKEATMKSITTGRAWRESLVLLCAGLISGVLNGVALADSIVLVGAGQSGTWITQLEATNAGAAASVMQVDAAPRFDNGPCAGPCAFVQVGIPGKGTVALRDDQMRRAIGEGLGTVYVTPQEGSSLPSVRARVVNTARPGQGVEIPGVRLSTLLALNASALSFPGASANGATHSNLVLTNLLREGETQPEAMSLLVEAFSAQGASLGAREVSLAAGETLFLINVLETLGVPLLDRGSIRVSRTNSERAFWGLLYTIDADGGVRVSVGKNP